MLNFCSAALVALLAATATSKPVNQRRQEPTSQVVFRSDLKSGEGQSPEFKNLLLSTVANNKSASGFDITFVNLAELDQAAHGVVESKGIPFSLVSGPTSSTQYLNTGTDPSDATAPQPVSLGKTQSSKGFLYTQGGELKLGSTTPQWDTWIICDGENHPELSWVGVVKGVVEIPEGCSAVRLFAEDPADPTKNMGSC